jgi:hypothetical protein
MEAIQFYMLGYASAEETARQIVRYASRAKKAKMPGKGTL